MVCLRIVQDSYGALEIRTSFTDSPFGLQTATVLILALGISATTALFSVSISVLWKPLPYPDAGRLVSLYEANPAQQQNTSLIAPVRLEDWNRLNRTFQAISGGYAENA